jgi:hypothetical protein
MKLTRKVLIEKSPYRLVEYINLHIEGFDTELITRPIIVKSVNDTEEFRKVLNDRYIHRNYTRLELEDYCLNHYLVIDGKHIGAIIKKVNCKILNTHI